jgi:3-hydroxyisobutyrate dehydrogenase-like beta-hydroxyacid dehydrogenase
MTAVGFMGFGEVAACFSAALIRNGVAVAAYDLLLDQFAGIEVLKERAAGSNVTFLPLHEVIASSDFVISSVTSDVAPEVAIACVPHLNAGQVFIDLNATSPAVKRDIAAKLSASGLQFVEGAILSAIGVSGAESRVLVCGHKAALVADTLSKHGLNVKYYGGGIGRASTFKLLRSIFSKGVEALLLEARLAARQAGLDSEVWREIVETLDGHEFSEIGRNWMRSHGTAHARRYHEMVQVEALVQELGIDPLMTRATTAFFERSTRLGLSQALRSRPRTPEDVLAALQELLPNAMSDSRLSGAT